MASFSPDCRTYRDIPCRIRLSIASLLKISAFRKPRSLPTILAGSFLSSRLYLSAQSFQIKHPQATGRAVCKLPNWFHPCIAAQAQTSKPTSRTTDAHFAPTSVHPPFLRLRRPHSEFLPHLCSLHSWRICDAIQQPFQRIKAGRHPQASLPHGAADVFPRRRRTDRQPAANRTGTAPRISIPTTSSSFLRQKAPQAGIKHASAPALRKHMP